MFDTNLLYTRDVSHLNIIDCNNLFAEKCFYTAIVEALSLMFITDSGMLIDKIELQLLNRCYESGRISLRVCGEQECAMVPSGTSLG